MSLAAYQDIINGPLERFMQCSANLQHVQDQAALVKKLFQTQFEYLTMASRSSPPTNQNDTVSQLKGHTEGIEGIQKARESNKTSPNFTFLSAISESIPALGWVCVKPTPAPYIKEMNDVGKYYTNRILKESKGNQQQTNWCVAWTETLGSLEAFVKQYHTTGLVWGGAGAGAGAPPPPPCPPPCMPPPPDMSDDGGADERTALFAQINQGADITKNLKKVTADMQTHKNTTLREGPAPFKTPVGAPKPFAKSLPTPGAGQVPTKPPSMVKDGKKWLIEYQVGNTALEVSNAEMNNVVYMFRCRDSLLTVSGKINSIVLDSCTKCAVVFDSLVSSVEFVNCQSVKMEVRGKVPTISIDKTDGCQMYLSADSMDVEIVSSKSSEMNVMMPKGNGDYTEMAIAEQFKTTINKPNKSLVTIAVENKG
ncbi:adenylyl cyclase-associated protein 1 isoform X2 [Arctopsyche grandis]